MTQQLTIDFESPPRFAGADFRCCTKCNASKPLADYYISNGKASSACKDCVKRLMKRTPEQVKADRESQQQADARWLKEYLAYWQEHVNSYPGEWPSDENWRPVVGYEGLYEVSDKGRVRSLWFENGTVAKRRHIPHVRVQYKTDFGYWTVTLVKGGKHETRCVHALVCEAFRGPAPEDHICGHRDGNPSNNLLDNVRWITYSINNGDDRHAHGTALTGSRNHQAKLTELDVRQMLALHAAGTPVNKLSDLFGISKSVASKIVRRESWKHVTENN